jgi:hypothetical protein
MLHEIVAQSYWKMAWASKPDKFRTLDEILGINKMCEEQMGNALWELLGMQHTDEFIDCWDSPLLVDLDTAFVKIYVMEKQLCLHFGAWTPEAQVLWTSYVEEVMEILINHNPNTISFPALLTAKMVFQLHWDKEDDEIPVPLLMTSSIDTYQSILEKLLCAIHEVNIFHICL